MGAILIVNGKEGQSAHYCLEAFARAAPATKFVIVSLAKGKVPGKDRAASEAHPQVSRLFGRLDSKAAVSGIVPLIRETLEGKPR